MRSRELVGADGVHEWPVAVTALGGEPRSRPRPAAGGEVAAAPRELPLATAAQHAGDHDGLGPPWVRGTPVEAPGWDGPVEQVVLSRARSGGWIQTRGLPRACARLLARRAPRHRPPHFVVVHAVDGLDPGSLPLAGSLRPGSSGRLRSELFRVCLDQGLPRDAAFVVIGAADVGALDDRTYREAQLAAGMVEGRLHLAAYALGASASGMTFLDSEIPASSATARRAAVHMRRRTGYGSTAGGLPGAAERSSASGGATPSTTRGVESMASDG